MRLQIHAEFENPTELATFAKLLAESAEGKTTSVTAPKASATVTSTKSEKEPVAAAPKVEKAAKTDEPAPAKEKSPSVLDPTYPNMKAAVLLVSKTVGRVQAEDILKKYGGEKEGKLVVGPHIPEANFADIITACNKALASK